MNISKENLKVIIFDFDDTVYNGADWSSWGEYVEEFLKGVFNNNLNKVEEFVKNYNITNKTNGQTIAKATIETMGSAKAFVKFLDKKLYPIYSDSLRWIENQYFETLSKKYSLYIVSNSSTVHTKHYLKYFKINKSYFKKIYRNSFLKEDITKAVVYKEIIKREKVNAEEILIIGDNYNNDIVPALGLGINGIHSTTLEQTKQVLEDLI